MHWCGRGAVAVARAHALRRTAATVAAALVMVSIAVPSAAAERHRAGVLVRDSSGRVHRMCVFFDTTTTTGLALLRKSGYDVELSQSSLGTAVCKIGGDGCSSGKCFCHYPTFWGYWTREPGTTKWKFSDVGAQARQVRNGALDAWVWGKDGKPEPPAVSFRDVCPLAAAEEKTTRKKTNTNYAAFGAFVGLFALAGVLLARRRATRRPTP